MPFPGVVAAGELLGMWSAPVGEGIAALRFLLRVEVMVVMFRFLRRSPVKRARTMHTAQTDPRPGGAPDSTYSASLQYLVDKLQPQGYTLSAGTLRNYEPDDMLNLWKLIAGHLRLDNDSGSVVITGATAGGGQGICTITGTVSVLKMQNVPFKATLQDTVASAKALTPRYIPRAVTAVLEITTPELPPPDEPPTWKMSTSFPEVQGTIFDKLSFTERPVFILSSYAHRDPVRKIAIEAGLNFYGRVKLEGDELNIVASILKPSVDPILAGPIQQGRTAVFDLALYRPDGLPYQRTYPTFPTFTFEAHLQTVIPVVPDPLLASAVQVTLTAQLDLSSALTRASGSLPLTGVVTENSTLTLAYDVVEPTPIDLLKLGQLVAKSDKLRDALPESLRESQFSLAQVLLEMTATDITTATFGVGTPRWPTVSILQRIEALLSWVPTQDVTCDLTGFVVSPNGLSVQASNDQGFPYPFTLTHDTADLHRPEFATLAKAFNLAENLPTDIAQMGTSYAIQDFVVRIDDRTSATAFTHLTMQSPWTLVRGQHLTFKVEKATITLRWNEDKPSSGTIEGNTSFLDENVHVQLALPAPPSHLLSVPVPSPAFQFPHLASGLLGSIAIPNWLNNVRFTHGQLDVDYSTWTFINTSQFAIADSIPPGDGTSLINMSAFLSVDNQTASLCLVGTWQWDQGDSYEGKVCDAYPDDTNPPFSQFQDDVWHNLVPIPKPQNTPPNQEKDTATLALYITAAIAAGIVAIGAIILFMKAFGWFGLQRMSTKATKALLAVTAVSFLLSTMLIWMIHAFGDNKKERVRDFTEASNNTIPPTEMASALIAVDPHLSADACADALTGGYSLSAQEMTVALRSAAFPAPAVAPVIYKRYPQETDIAEKMAILLLHAYGTLSVSTMAEALAATAASVPYAPLAVAPVLYRHYPGETTTAEAMATILQGAYRTLTAPTLVSALASIPYPVYEATQATIHRYPAQTATVFAVARLLLTAGYAALPTLPVLQLDFPLATQTAWECARVFHDADCPEAAARVSLLAVDFPPAVVDDAMRLVYTERTTMMLLNNLAEPHQSQGKSANFEITSSTGDTVTGQIAPWGSRYIVPAGPPPYSVQMGVQDNSYTDTVTGIASADVVATLFFEVTFAKVFVSSPGEIDQ
jgi:hypothetical protein